MSPYQYHITTPDSSSSPFFAAHGSWDVSLVYCIYCLLALWLTGDWYDGKIPDIFPARWVGRGGGCAPSYHLWQQQIPLIHHVLWPLTWLVAVPTDMYGRPHTALWSEEEDWPPHFARLRGNVCKETPSPLVDIHVRNWPLFCKLQHAHLNKDSLWASGEIWELLKVLPT